MKETIYGIQQIGLGVRDARAAFRWYARAFGLDVLVFEDAQRAELMAPFMGNRSHEKLALLALNLSGGSGIEFWQYTDKTPLPPTRHVQCGDWGINAMHFKSANLPASFHRLEQLGANLLTDIYQEPDGRSGFYLLDPFGNLIQVKESDSWYAMPTGGMGGVMGCSVGVSDIEASLPLYSGVLGYHRVVYDKIEKDSKFPFHSGAFRRVLLAHDPRKGGFSKLFGASEIELIQKLDVSGQSIFQDRHWGDLGMIHLCFDIHHMAAMSETCTKVGYPFQVESKPDFEMGKAAGHWAYTQDPDGSLIEFVETYRVPLVKKLKVNWDLQKRDPYKDVPDWLIRGLAMKRVKFPVEVMD